ncbi:SOS response-associated peptidase [Natribacillus halophilus]|uniref:Abasic site processing protein n=1 Tax=Natribacillus halophilus TaxID=549003 RepID=A0A1G8M869_9BACI|nr:SOS response-associated peptidase [Natribacillus halophilus]SDI64122.1 Putative SOS response-associated peptidase YedK [Natribacillus halophilus]
MCGRFTLYDQIKKIRERFGIDVSAVTDVDPSFNIAPSQSILAIINDGEQNRLGRLRWGLIPFWAKDTKIGYKMINARAETVAEKNSFKQAFKWRRCLIPANGFYEWTTTAGQKQPYHIQMQDGALFAFAGLWEKWTDGEEDIFSCSIITTEANDLMRDIHDRMPVILSREHEQKWLDPTMNDPEKATNLLQPFPANEMKAYQVSTNVNSPKNNHAALLHAL